MRRALLLTLVGLVSLIAPAAAQAQGFELLEPLLAVTTDPSAANTFTSTSLTARATGEIVVSFHAAQATGCATHGACAYHGTVVINLDGGGDLRTTRYRTAGREVQTATLDLTAGAFTSPRSTWARVQRDLAGGGAASCVDTQPSGLVDGVRVGHFYRFALADLLTPTRCAGPLPADLVGALPRLVVSDAEFAHGGGRVDLRGAHAFSADGFAGVATSTVVLRLGRPETLPASPVTGARTTRVVSQSLRITRAAGALTLDVHGSSDPSACAFLDTCGLFGSVTIRPRPARATGILIAAGPARRPLRDFLAALGRRAFGARARGITVLGYAVWSGGGTVSTQVSHAASCSDTAPLGAGLVVLGAAARGLAADYVPDSQSTRCPGPMAPSQDGIALGIVPWSQLRGLTFTITLRPFPAAYEDDGYTVSAGGEVRLTFQRSEPAQQITAWSPL